MSDYDALDNFTLKDHGDRWEREWCSLLEVDFPSYEVFWRRYIVPLTKRVTTASEHEWTQLRPGITPRLEQMAMSHYSVFYFMARAKQRIKSVEPSFPEDVFALFDACSDNLLQFFAKVSEILSDFGEQITLPNQVPKLGPFVEVQSYRDTLLHNPVLARLSDQGVIKLPKHEHLNAVRRSWSGIVKLQLSDFVPETDLYNRLLSETTTYLEQQWTTIIAAFDSVRDTDKFKRQWLLDGFLPIKTPQQRGFTVHSSTGSAVSSATTVTAVIWKK